MDKSKKAVEIYDKVFLSYEKEFRKPSEYINNFLNLVSKNGNILDVGCGIGVDASYIKSKGFNVLGVDLSKNMLKLARRKFPLIDFRIGDMRKLSFEKSSFDGIFVAYSLIHIPKKEVFTVIKKLYSFLKINGIIYFAVQGGESSESFIKEPLSPSENIFLNVFSYNELKETLQRAGFTLIKKYTRKSRKKGELGFNKLFILAKK